MFTKIEKITTNKKFFTLSKYTYRIGMSALFTANAVVAFVTPDSFRSLLEANVIFSNFPSILITSMVVIAGVNDAILAVLILSGRIRLVVYAWIGAWFAVIALVKFMNLVW